MKQGQGFVNWLEVVSHSRKIKLANGLLLIVLLERHFIKLLYVNSIVGKEIFNICITYEGSPFFT